MAEGVLGVYEVQLATTRLERMREFHEGLLGLAATVVDPERGRVHYGLGEGAGQVILARVGGEQLPPAWPGLPPAAWGEDEELAPGPAAHGPVHWALHVDEAGWTRIVEAWREAGVEVRGPVSWGPRLRSVYALDPDGNCVELIGDVASLVGDAPSGAVAAPGAGS